MGKDNKASENTFPFLAGAMLLLALLLFLEAVFQASKVSQFSKLSLYQQLAMLLNSLLLLSIPIIVLWLLLYLSARLLYRNQKTLRVIYFGYSFILGFLFFFIVFTHVDTFLYTALKWNIYSLPLSANIVLLVLLIDAAALLIIKRGQRISNFFFVNRTKIYGIILVVLALSFLAMSQKLYATWRDASVLEKELAGHEGLEYRPNIILVSADSLDCRRLGAYGYVRDTTPNIDSLENITLYTRAYTNCGNSRGSIISILTGKSPITTKLVFPPDILHGEHAFQHLPNMLARLGYYNVDLNDGFYASTSKSNMRDGFHSENDHKSDFATGLGFWKRLRITFSDETYFLRNLFETYKNKLSFMVGGSPPLFDYDRFLVWGEGSDWTDRKRLDTLAKIIRETDQPLFAHIHLVTTHGPLFMPPLREFSANRTSTESAEEAAALEDQRRQYYTKNEALGKFDIKFDHHEIPPDDRERHWNLYDDAVLSVDNYAGEIIRTLHETEKLDDTLLIFFTDHGMGYFTTDLDKVRYPLPLIVRIPGQKERIVIDRPVQYIDIAPSILKFLNQPIPEWMEGKVIFEKAASPPNIPGRILVAAGFVSENTKLSVVMGAHANKIEVGPPYFGMDLFGLTANGKYYLYSTELNAGALYDISRDPYDFRVIDEPQLEHEYYDRLYKHLEERGIFLKQGPA